MEYPLADMGILCKATEGDTSREEEEAADTADEDEAADCGESGLDATDEADEDEGAAEGD